MTVTDVQQAALGILACGFQPVPLWPKTKKPIRNDWVDIRYERAQVLDPASFFAREGENAVNLGVLTGLGGLVDVDLDDPVAEAAADFFLPPPLAVSGRASTPRAHRWYVVEDTEARTAQFATGRPRKMIVEVRARGGQTLVPPSVHDETGERYEWAERTDPYWSSVLHTGSDPVPLGELHEAAAQIAMVAVLARSWPGPGGRHDAYLALAGALLTARDGLDPYWSTERRVGRLVKALAVVTGDEEASVRVREAVVTTAQRLASGRSASGWPTLSTMIEAAHVEAARKFETSAREAAGFAPRGAVPDLTIKVVDDRKPSSVPAPASDGDEPSSWAPVDLRAAADGGVEPPVVSLLEREDGAGLLYPGRLSMLIGASESGKTWLAMHTALQVVESGGTVVYVDMEDSVDGFLWRLKQLGKSVEDVMPSLDYVAPDEQISPLQHDRWGSKTLTESGVRASLDFQALVRRSSPSLIVVDGLTVLLGLHGLNSNDAVAVEHVGRWLRHLAGGESKPAVLLLDHTGKGAERGSEPVGSQHKKSMVTGAMLQTWVLTQPVVGALGRVEVVVIKDRAGAVRAVSEVDANQVAVCARMVVDSTGETTDVRLYPPDHDWGPRGTTIDLGKATAGVTKPTAPASEPPKEVDLLAVARGLLADGSAKTLKDFLSIVPDTIPGSSMTDILEWLVVVGEAETSVAQTRDGAVRTWARISLD